MQRELWPPMYRAIREAAYGAFDVAAVGGNNDLLPKMYNAVKAWANEK